jgi:hypothetical protein
MFNVNQITSQLAKMPDPMLQKYAAMHKNDPYTVSLALAESNRRKAMRVGAALMPGEQPKVVDQDIAEMAPPQQMPHQMPQQMAQQQLPENVGIGQLPAQNMQRMADGGIVGYAGDQGSVTRMTGADLFDKALDKEGITDPLRRAFAKAIHGQESSSGVTAKTSNRGAAGPMQVRSGAWKDVSSPDMDPKNPFDNMRVGIRYAMKGFEASNGNPVLAGAYYYGGPGGMKKLMEGKAVSDPENPNAPTTAGYGASVAKRMTALLPVGAAAAATTEKPVVPTAAPAAAPAAVSRGTNEVPQAVDFSKPAQTTAAPVAPRSQFQAMLDAGRGIVGAGETALQYGTGMLAIPTAGVASLLGSKTTQEAEDKYRKYAGDVTYQPRTEAGQNISESTRRVLEDLKVPPVLAHAGNLPPKRGGARVASAELSELANRMTKEAETPRLAGPTTSETMIQGRDQPPVRQGPAVAQQMADIENAKSFQQAAAANKANERIPSTTPEILERNAQLVRAQAVAAGSSPASNAGLATLNQNQPNRGLPMDDLGYDKSGLDALDKTEKKELIDIGKTATPDGRGKDFSNDMLLMLGLNMMAGQSPNFLTNVGQAGIGALKYGQEAKKEASEQMYREALSKHYGVDPMIQRATALQDPAIARQFAKMKELEREPVTKEALLKAFMGSPEGMAASSDPDKFRTAFQNYIQSYESVLGPIGGMPPNVKVTRSGP